MPSHQPIAQIFCRYVDKQVPGDLRPGKGFVESRRRRETCFTRKSCASLDIYLFSDQLIQVGRTIEHNDIAILHPYISRQHFVIYSIEYEEGAQPLVYVRDQHSLSGTYVDNHTNCLMRVVPSSGYLLDQGDIIRLDPYWEFHVHLLATQPIDPSSIRLSSSETKFFRNRFLITTRILGSGGFADVHLAIDLKSRRQLACKIHRFNLFRHCQRFPGMIQRILDETNILSRLTHPNLLKFEAAFRSLDTLYTFTELATGGDLFSMRLRHPDGLPEMDTKTIIWQIVEVVRYLHEQNVAHRDLKPENIFFATGPTIMTRVIVGDLGFAKVATSGRMASEIGTHRFMAPEIYRGHAYCTKVDIWSIGMISLFLVALDWNSLGCFETFDQDTVNASVVAVFGELSRHQPRKALSNDFGNFIRACLVVTPSYRMTAEDAKNHDWFLLCRSRLEAQIQAFTSGWRPAQVVHNTVEDLNLFGTTRAQSSPSPVSLSDGNMEGGITQCSPYFATSGLTKCKRQGAFLTPPLIKLTRVNGKTSTL